ncbi:serine/threonine-protein kinase [Streptomyces sp. ISL-11]|uniref:serine/threonine-protein kinase n=1 Tax=Streptomyces sp. ISL-11 TaxID=2819174 RepID=UPI001BE9D42A|nr:serine/threonine-protein kinase [Streptomyces sp. ISL-11]MBT2382879.1 serine/threonine protein kinase [Streptomyces sp. ISL-11]
MDGERRNSLLAGRYRLVDQLGSGGMGVVWRAVDELLDREVAAKEVRAPDHLSEQDVRVLYARLKQEARAAARVNHPCVITVHDVVEQEGRPWIVMEFVRGRSLADVLQHDGVLDPREAAKVGSMILQALRSAHASGVLHRDVKPANVLLQPDGRVVLTDFGIALVEGSGTLTRTGDLVGSPDFLAPERALGERPGAPSDLWSLGATLYAAVEGVSPFRRTSALSTLHAVVQEDPPVPRRAGPLTPLLEGLLRKDPRARMGSEEALRMLDAVAAGHPTTQHGGAGVIPGRGYVPTAVATPAPTPAPVTAPARPTPVSPSPTPGPAAHGSGPALPLYGRLTESGSLRAPGAGPGGGEAVVVTGRPPAVPVPPPTRRRLVALFFGSLLALLLIGGGAVAVLAARGAEDPGTSGGSVSTGTPGPTGDDTTAETSPPATDPSADPSTEPTPPSSAGSTAGSCGGGWVATCLTR